MYLQMLNIKALMSVLLSSSRQQGTIITEKIPN